MLSSLRLDGELLTVIDASGLFLAALAKLLAEVLGRLLKLCHPLLLHLVLSDLLLLDSVLSDGERRHKSLLLLDFFR